MTASRKARTGDKTNICFDCQLATGRCTWSALDPETGDPAFRPVPGWTADPVQILLHYDSGEPILVDTYHITACPMFIPDPPRESDPAQMAVEDLQRLLKKW